MSVCVTESEPLARAAYAVFRICSILSWPRLAAAVACLPRSALRTLVTSTGTRLPSAMLESSSAAMISMTRYPSRRRSIVWKDRLIAVTRSGHAHVAGDVDGDRPRLAARARHGRGAGGEHG